MIRTKRMTIRPLNYFELKSRVYSGVGFIKSEEDKSEFIKNAVEKMDVPYGTSNKFYTIWVAEISGGIEVLECGFICPPTPQKVLEVFCYTKPEFQKQGYGLEAINGLTRYASGLDVDYVCASVKQDNIASQRMMGKAGYYYLTTHKEHKIYNYHINN